MNPCIALSAACCAGGVKVAIPCLYVLPAHLIGGRRGVADAAVRKIGIRLRFQTPLDGRAGAGRPRAGVNGCVISVVVTLPDVRDGVAVDVEEVGAEGLVCVAYKIAEVPAVKGERADSRLGHVLGQWTMIIVRDSFVRRGEKVLLDVPLARRPCSGTAACSRWEARPRRAAASGWIPCRRKRFWTSNLTLWM